jgi:hypothetical protein
VLQRLQQGHPGKRNAADHAKRMTPLVVSIAPKKRQSELKRMPPYPRDATFIAER